jgi:hypothetical protein
MVQGNLQKLIFGFIAAALSVVVFHQTMVLAVGQAGLISAKPWSLDPVGPLAVPSLVNGIFWAGLWGALFALVWPHIPGASLPVKGAIFGLLGPILTGRWLLVPLIKGEPLFAGWNLPTMAAHVLIGLAFGAGLAWIYSKLTAVSAAA